MILLPSSSISRFFELIWVKHFGHVDHVQQASIYRHVSTIWIEADVYVVVLNSAYRRQIWGGPDILDCFYIVCREYVLGIPSDYLLKSDIDLAAFTHLSYVSSTCHLQRFVKVYGTRKVAPFFRVVEA